MCEVTGGGRWREGENETETLLASEGKWAHPPKTQKRKLKRLRVLRLDEFLGSDTHFANRCGQLSRVAASQGIAPALHPVLLAYS